MFRFRPIKTWDLRLCIQCRNLYVYRTFPEESNSKHCKECFDISLQTSDPENVK